MPSTQVVLKVYSAEPGYEIMCCGALVLAVTGRGGMMVQQVALLHHGSRVLGSILNSVTTCVEFLLDFFLIFQFSSTSEMIWEVDWRL